jgi:hypothetical protein
MQMQLPPHQILIAEANEEISDVFQLLYTLFIVYFWFQIGLLVGVLSETRERLINHINPLSIRT